LLLELSNLPQVFTDPKRRILELRYDARRPVEGWDHLAKLAKRTGTAANDLYKRVKPSAAELSRPVLSS
jgi:hypothetical protein